MGWYFLTFAFGAAFCFAIVFLWAASAVDKAKPHSGQLIKKYSATLRRLEQSKRRFGQIANRESIGEARKIANTALKELNDGGEL